MARPRRTSPLDETPRNRYEQRDEDARNARRPVVGVSTSTAARYDGRMRFEEQLEQSTALLGVGQVARILRHSRNTLEQILPPDYEMPGKRGKAWTPQSVAAYLRTRAYDPGARLGWIRAADGLGPLTPSQMGALMGGVSDLIAISFLGAPFLYEPGEDRYPHAGSIIHHRFAVAREG